jgi:glyoxylase-like metal-dependent hydrolase (beta-lactamase superfamily II)
VIPPFKLAKNVSLLGTEFFNLYLIKGDTYAIIEGGVSGITYLFLKQLSQYNIPPESISHLVILHSHFDHMMVFPALKQMYPWVKMVTSELNRAIFSSERIVAKIFDADRKMTRALMESGLISEAPNLSPYTSFPFDISVEEGSTLDLGNGVGIKFFDAPGHAPDNLCAYQEKEGILFCSDAAGFYIPPDFFRPNYWFSLEEAQKSLEKMKRLDPEVLCRGHYGSVTGKEMVKRHLQMASQAIEDFKIYVSENIQLGNSIEEIAEEVTERFSKGFLELFPPEENYRLWRLMIQRTLEHFGIEIEER